MVTNIIEVQNFPKYVSPPRGAKKGVYCTVPWPGTMDATAWKMQGARIHMWVISKYYDVNVELVHPIQTAARSGT